MVFLSHRYLFAAFFCSQGAASAVWNEGHLSAKQNTLLNAFVSQPISLVFLSAKQNTLLNAIVSRPISLVDTSAINFPPLSFALDFQSFKLVVNLLH
jgi:hypothetical protein